MNNGREQVIFLQFGEQEMMSILIWNYKNIYPMNIRQLFLRYIEFLGINYYDGICVKVHPRGTLRKCASSVCLLHTIERNAILHSNILFTR